MSISDDELVQCVESVESSVTYSSVDQQAADIQFVQLSAMSQLTIYTTKIEF